MVHVGNWIDGPWMIGVAWFQEAFEIHAGKWIIRIGG